MLDIDHIATDLRLHNCIVRSQEISALRLGKTLNNNNHNNNKSGSSSSSDNKGGN